MSDNLVPLVDPHSPASGSTVGPWLVLERLDSGSYGVVFRARRADHPESPLVALKMARQARDARFAREVWLSWASAAVVGGMLVVAFTELRHPAPVPREDWRVAEEWHAPPLETPDAGVGDMALTEVLEVPRVGDVAFSLGLPMPKTPQPGQRKPPCDRGQRAINGACWAGPIEGERAPCGQKMFDHEDKCYFIVFNAPRSPTAEQP